LIQKLLLILNQGLFRGHHFSLMAGEDRAGIDRDCIPNECDDQCGRCGYKAWLLAAELRSYYGLAPFVPTWDIVTLLKKYSDIAREAEATAKARMQEMAKTPRTKGLSGSARPCCGNTGLPGAMCHFTMSTSLGADVACSTGSRAGIDSATRRPGRATVDRDSATMALCDGRAKTPLR
jgi:hypothetical protein